MNSVLRILVGAAIGAMIGFAIYRFVGCRTGACPLTANPAVAITIYALLGALIGAGK